MKIRKKIKYSESFNTNFKKRISSYEYLKKDFEEARALFKVSPYHESLRRHGLNFHLIGIESIDLNEDYRILFNELDTYYLFIDIGNHKQLYG